MVNGQLFSELGIPGLRAPEIRQIIVFCDRDGDGMVSPKELCWLLTEPDRQTEALKFWDIPDVRTWLQQDFHAEDPGCASSAVARSSRAASIAPATD